MEYRVFGRSGMRVSAVGLGGGGIGHVWGPTTDEECVEVVRRALDLGVNFIDLAPLYGDGKAEEIVGQATRGRRGQCYYATKISWQPPERREDLAGYIRSSLEASLKRLQTDYVDLLQIHPAIYRERRRPPQPPGGSGIGLDDVLGRGGYLEVFRQLQQEGLVRFVGFSGQGEVEVLRQLIETDEFDSMQVYYNLLTEFNLRGEGPSSTVGSMQGRGTDLLDLAYAHRMGLIGIRPLAAGVLTPAIDRPVEPGSDTERDIRLVEKLSFLMGGEIRSLTEAAMVFALMNPKISTAVPGVKSVAELEECVGALDKRPLSAEALERLASLGATAQG